MSKSQKKESSEVFTIQFDTMDESSEIPGIAQLLGSKTSAKEAAQLAAENGSVPAKPGVKFNRSSTSVTSLKNLKEFGTRLEIHFLLKDEAYRYAQHNDLSHSKFFGLDELFHDMKVSMFFVQEFGVFGEFKASEHAYLFDAFGVSDFQFLQFVLNQGNKILSVYVSEKSMMSKKDDVIAYAEAHNQNLSASGLDIDQAA